MSESLKSLLEQFSITTTLYTEDQLSGAPEHSKTKCLVLKPKAAKTAVDAPAHVLVVAFQDTQVNMSNLAKHIGVKELRMAQEDVVTQVFKVSKEAGSYNHLLIFSVTICSALFRGNRQTNCQGGFRHANN